MLAKLAPTVNRIEKLNRLALWLGLNGFALGVFFLVGVRYNYLHPDNMGRLMFSSPDTKQYREIADWLNGKTANVPASTRLRPLLYPLLLASVRRMTDNAYAFWAMQFSLWLSAINLTSLTVYQFTKRNILLIIAFCLMALNVSASVMTFFALTETLTLFLWAVWLWVFAQTNLRDPQTSKLFLLTFLLSLLTITKPIFQIHLAIFLGYIFYKHIRHFKLIAAVTVAIMPVALQILLNLNLHSMPSVSDISTATVKWYLAPQVYASRNAVSLDDARQAIASYDSTQTLTYLVQNGTSALAFFLQNLFENLTGASDYISYYPKPYLFTRVTNIVYLIIHSVFLPALIYLFLTKTHPLTLTIKLIYIFSTLILLTSGISFNEGDRLVMTALPLWVVVYALVLFSFSTRNEDERKTEPS